MEAKLGGSSGVNGHWGHCEGTGARGQLGGQRIGVIKEKTNNLAVLGKKRSQLIGIVFTVKLKFQETTEKVCFSLVETLCWLCKWCVACPPLNSHTI